MRIAVLADIHGNLPALQAVLGELERLQPDHVILNGDLINAVPFSAEVVDLVRARDWAVVRGNHEFYYLDLGSERAAPGFDDPTRWGQLHWLAERITPAQGAYLAMLPDERLICLPGTLPMRVAHGVPGRNRTGFYTDQPASSIAAEIAGIVEQTVISAHTHVQVDRHICLHANDTVTDVAPAIPGGIDGELDNGLDGGLDSASDRASESGNDTAIDVFADPHRMQLWSAAPPERRWHVINPGSVGLPLNGDVRAQFAILESVDPRYAPGGWRATHLQVAYDRRPALAAYAETGMLAAGGAITHLFYWELVTGEPEIVNFFRWARQYNYDPDRAMEDAFRAYCEQTGRLAYVKARDPLSQPTPVD